MFNIIAKSFPSQTLGSSFIFSHSNKVLSLQDIDKKIKGARKHIAHLTSQLRNRKTHGGKAFRARKISLQGQIFLSLKRLELLKKTQMSRSKSQVEEEKTVSSMRGSTARRVVQTPWNPYSNDPTLTHLWHSSLATYVPECSVTWGSEVRTPKTNEAGWNSLNKACASKSTIEEVVLKIFGDELSHSTRRSDGSVHPQTCLASFGNVFLSIRTDTHHRLELRSRPESSYVEFRISSDYSIVENKWTKISDVCLRTILECGAIWKKAQIDFSTKLYNKITQVPEFHYFPIWLIRIITSYNRLSPKTTIEKLCVDPSLIMPHRLTPTFSLLKKICREAVSQKRELHPSWNILNAEKFFDYLRILKAKLNYIPSNCGLTIGRDFAELILNDSKKICIYKSSNYKIPFARRDFLNDIVDCQLVTLEKRKKLSPTKVLNCLCVYVQANNFVSEKKKLFFKNAMDTFLAAGISCPIKLD